MTFPQFTQKHREIALFSPQDFLKYKNWDNRKFPKKFVIVYQRDSLKHFKRKYRGEYSKLDESITGHEIYELNDVGFIKMNGIGSPHAVTTFEELIALGVREYVNIGTAGGLLAPGVYLCSKALRDEGTSHHYLAHGKFAHPDKSLTKRLAESLSISGLEFNVAPSWTIDAPYRETKAEIAKYRKEGIATVEMEASALFAVAKVRKVKIAAAFVVSDVLEKKWEPRFHHLDVKKTLGKLVDASLSCLGGKK